MDDREAAWSAIQEALPARWRVGPVSFDPGGHAWSVTAIGPHPGRGKIPQSVTGIGEDEAAALRALRQRLRLAYVTGAEEWSTANAGRSLTGDELGRVLGRYVGR